jgi:hypothetical protein
VITGSVVCSNAKRLASFTRSCFGASPRPVKAQARTSSAIAAICAA